MLQNRYAAVDTDRRGQQRWCVEVVGAGEQGANQEYVDVSSGKQGEPPVFVGKTNDEFRIGHMSQGWLIGNHNTGGDERISLYQSIDPELANLYDAYDSVQGADPAPSVEPCSALDGNGQQRGPKYYCTSDEAVEALMEDDAAREAIRAAVAKVTNLSNQISFYTPPPHTNTPLPSFAPPSLYHNPIHLVCFWGHRLRHYLRRFWGLRGGGNRRRQKARLLEGMPVGMRAAAESRRHWWRYCPPLTSPPLLLSPSTTFLNRRWRGGTSFWQTISSW